MTREEALQELVERVRCTEYVDSTYVDCVDIEAMRIAIEVLKENQSDWTPVSEGLPKENKSVIASTLYGIYPEAKYTKEYGWEWAYEAGMDYWRELKDVTAWMPLPEPYKGEKE